MTVRGVFIADIKKAIIDAIARSKKISLFFHEKPDPDTLGCAFAMRQFITDNFPDKKVVIAGLHIVQPHETANIFRIEEQIPDSDIQGSLAIVMDTANRERIADQRYTMAADLIKIDHHPDLDKFGSLSWVQDRVSSACELVAEMLFASKLKISPQTAAYLYTGIVTDTGGFRFHAVNHKTHLIAAKLLKTGMDKGKVHAALGAKTEADTRAIGYILTNFEVKRNGVASLLVKSTGKAPFSNDDVKKLINVMSGIEGIEVWSICVFDKENKTWRASFRSRSVEINGICQKWGGGGHRHAAGTELASAKDYETMLDECAALITASKGLVTSEALSGS